MNNTMNTRPMTEGAMLTALTVILCIVGIYVPVIGGLAKFLWPVPIAILVLRHGLRIGILATVVSGIILFILTGPLNLIITVLGFGLTGLVLGYTIRRGINSTQVVLWGAVASALSILATIVLATLLTGINPIDTIIKMQHASLEKTLPMWLDYYRSIGAKEQQIKMIEQMIKGFPAMMRMLLPATLAMGAVTSSFLNFVVARLILVRMGQPIAGLPRFRDWRFPVWVAYAYVLGLGLTLFSAKLGFPDLRPIGVNLVTVLSYLFFLEGLSLLVYLFADAKVSRGVKIGIGIVAFVFLSYIFQILIYVGIFDCIFNYRRIVDQRRSGV